MLLFFFPQIACLGKITSFCSAVPAKPTISPTPSPQRQQETPQQCTSCISCRCASLSMQLLRLSKLSEYLLSNHYFGTSHPAGDSPGSLRAWLMVMYALRKYTVVGNEPCIAGVENSLPQTSLMCCFWFTTGFRRALDSPSHISLGQT